MVCSHHLDVRLVPSSSTSPPLLLLHLVDLEGALTQVWLVLLEVASLVVFVLRYSPISLFVLVLRRLVLPSYLNEPTDIPTCYPRYLLPLAAEICHNYWVDRYDIFDPIFSPAIRQICCRHHHPLRLGPVADPHLLDPVADPHLPALLSKPSYG